MKARYKGQTDDLIFIKGKIYEVEYILIDDYYVVIDEVGDSTVWSKDQFDLINGSEEELDICGPDSSGKKIVLRKKGTPKNN